MNSFWHRSCLLLTFIFPSPAPLFALSIRMVHIFPFSFKISKPGFCHLKVLDCYLERILRRLLFIITGNGGMFDQTIVTVWSVPNYFYQYVCLRLFNYPFGYMPVVATPCSWECIASILWAKNAFYACFPTISRKIVKKSFSTFFLSLVQLLLG